MCDFNPRKKQAGAKNKSLRDVIQALKEDLKLIDINININQNKL